MISKGNSILYGCDFLKMYIFSNLKNMKNSSKCIICLPRGDCDTLTCLPPRHFVTKKIYELNATYAETILRKAPATLQTEWQC